MKRDFSFHPATLRWLESRFAGPTSAQARAWPKIQEGGDVLVLSPTGSGKTLAAFLSAVNDLIEEGLRSPGGQLPDETRVLYVSPLKALVTDIEQNLIEPLAGISRELEALGLSPARITTFARTGDTSMKDRASRAKCPPHIYITTPESLYILLTSESGRASLKTVEQVIIDEIHAFVPNKRGAHLALSLERLDALTLAERGKKPRRIGLSATQRPVDVVAEFLVGNARPAPTIVDETGPRELDIAIVPPELPLEAVMSADGWNEIYDRLAAFSAEHRTTLVFTNTRRLAERITRHLGERIGESSVACHHGSLSQKRRAHAEGRLKRGELKVLVATASLELGIDIGDVELVCQIGSPGRIATFLQRVGRACHRVGGVPKGRLFPLSRDDLVESVALFEAIHRGDLDKTAVPPGPLDVLLQQMVAEVAAAPRSVTDLFELFRRALPYRELTRETFNALVELLSQGFTTERGRRAAYLHYDSTSDVLRGRRGARLTAITNGGAIPDSFDYEVRLDPDNLMVGTVHEDFAVEAMGGDVFQLGNSSYRILQVLPGVVRVADAQGQPPNIPFWIGEAPARSDELSRAVSLLRAWVDERKKDTGLASELAARAGVDPKVAEEVVLYLLATKRALGALPTQTQLIAERFFDETDGMHVVLHAPFGTRINRALGLALRKRFCRSFNVELQAAAGDDAIVFSLGPMHSFPLEELFSFLHPESALSVLEQATLDAPLFQTRFRWNASRALSILRFRGGRKVPPRFQRMDADDLLATCFPDQVACLENIQGDREIPDHPLVKQTLFDALHEAMDAEGFLAVLRGLRGGSIRALARDVTEPSPAAHEILTARPYAFLDDAPIEERRTQAVQLRRFTGLELGSASLSQEAIEEVKSEIWPAPRDEEELHDTLCLYGYLRAEEGEALPGGTEWFERLEGLGRASRASARGAVFWVARERSQEFAAVHPGATWTGRRPEPLQRDEADQARARASLLRNRLEIVGPITADEAAESLRVSEEEALASLGELEAEGIVLRGSFRTDRPRATEFCERRILARIHRRTVTELRKRIEPVSIVRYLAFLSEWQGVTEGAKKRGVEGTRQVLLQLEGVSAPAAAWEKEILPARVADYSPGYLDLLCQSGEFVWRSVGGKARAPLKTTQVLLLPRDSSFMPRTETPEALGADASRIVAFLKERGASFAFEIQKGTGLLTAQFESALRELAAAGAVTTDSFLGLRLLIQSSAERERRNRRARGTHRGLESIGRISLLRPETDPEPAHSVEEFCRVLLRRWGVVTRPLLTRERDLPPYRELIREFHRLEARGEIRGGRFVAGIPGEQFALSDAIPLLRKQVPEASQESQLVSLSAVDPLNLVGVLTEDVRLPRLLGRGFVLSRGRLVATYEGSTIQIFEREGASSLVRNEVETAVRKGRLHPPRRGLGEGAQNLLV